MSETLRPRMEPPQESRRHTQVGMTDRRLEVRARATGHNFDNPRSKMTPTVDSDISERARVYKDLMSAAADHKQIIATSDHSDTQDIYRQSSDALRGIRHDVVVMGFSLTAFDMVVRDEVTLREKAAREEEMAGYEAQAERGDVPPRRDAGGFEPTRRGW